MQSSLRQPEQTSCRGTAAGNLLFGERGLMEHLMAKVRVAGFSLSIDGFGAGVAQGLQNPLGERGAELHEWAFGTRSFRTMLGKDGGSDGVDEDFARRAMDGFGA